MRLFTDKGELTVFFDPPKNLKVEVFGIDDVDYNCNLQFLSEPAYITGMFKDWPRIADASFTLDDKNRYKLYERRDNHDGEFKYLQYGGDRLCEHMEAEL